MATYNEDWHKVGDVREWERQGYEVRVYRTIKARALWDLINICATYLGRTGNFLHRQCEQRNKCKSLRPASRSDKPVWRGTSPHVKNIGGMSGGS